MRVEPLTGPETAEIWSTVLGRKVVYGGDDLEAWEQQSAAYIPPTSLYDFKYMYAHFQKRGLIATSEDVAACAKLLGHAPRTFENFAAETAKAWSEQGAGSVR